MRRDRLIRGLAALAGALIVAGSLATFSPGDWRGWGWDPSLSRAENAFGFLGAVLSKLMVSSLGRWPSMGIVVSFFLLLARREFSSRKTRRPLLLWGFGSLLLLLWAGWLNARFPSHFTSADWGGWLPVLLAEGQRSFLGKSGAAALPVFLTLAAVLAVIPLPRFRRVRRLRPPDLRPFLRAIPTRLRRFGSPFARAARRMGRRSVRRDLPSDAEVSSARSGMGEALKADPIETGAGVEEEPRALAASAGAPSSPSKKRSPAAAGATAGGKREVPFRPPASGEFVLPDSDLLSPPDLSTDPEDRRVMVEQARVLVDKLATFHIGGRVSAMKQGPVVTTFEFEPEAGVKVSQITGRREDLALALRSKELRLVAPIPGKAAVGIELPNRSPRIIHLREVIDAEIYAGRQGLLALALGVDVDGLPTWTDLSEAPHLLVAGATGTGKSVCINSILISLLLRHTPESLRLFLVDPKMLELSVYNDIPHLLHPVITDNKMALQALNWLVGEMESRYRRLKPAGVRSIAEYNAKVLAGEIRNAEGEAITAPLPFLVCVVEEFADLIMTLGKDIQTPIIRLAQLARAVGIHLILATQRPSVNIIDGVIKANFPSRISFKVFSRFDSKTILDANGAESLIGRGDMLFMHSRSPYPQRLHGAFVGTEEVRAVTDHWRQYTLPEPPLELEARPGSLEDFTAQDELYEDAKRMVILQGFGSTTMLQRRLRVGYTRASRLMDMLEDAGIVGPHTGSRAREVRVGPEALEQEIDS